MSTPELLTHVDLYGGPRDGEVLHWDLMLDAPIPLLRFIDSQSVAAQAIDLVMGKTAPDTVISSKPLTYEQFGPVVLSRLSGMAWLELDLPDPVPMPGEGRTIILKAQYRYRP